MQQLSYEKLGVYQKAIKFLAIVTRLLESIPKGNQTISDQFKRAEANVRTQEHVHTETYVDA